MSITDEDGKKTNIYMATDLITALNHKKEGETVYVEVLRGGNKVQKSYGTVIQGGERIKKVPVKLRCDVECKNLTMVDRTYKALGIGSTMMLDISESKWFEQGDYIKKISFDENESYKKCNNFVYTEQNLIDTLCEKKAGDTIIFWVGRNGIKEAVKVIVVLDSNWDKINKYSPESVFDYFGIDGYNYGYYTTGSYVKLGFFQRIGHVFEYSFKIGGTVLKSLGQIITGAIGLNAVGGTVTTIVTTTKVISYGFVYALEIAALIGVNLAVFNLLPIPALDGSRIVFCIIEWIRKKPISRKIEGIIHAIGFIFILGFAVLVDLLQFI